MKLITPPQSTAKIAANPIPWRLQNGIPIISQRVNHRCRQGRKHRNKSLAYPLAGQRIGQSENDATQTTADEVERECPDHRFELRRPWLSKTEITTCK